jgi:hypothetical protein
MEIESRMCMLWFDSWPEKQAGGLIVEKPLWQEGKAVIVAKVLGSEVSMLKLKVGLFSRSNLLLVGDIEK